MYKSLLFIAFLLCFISKTIAQNPFVGTYQGSYNNDNIVLTLQNSNGNTLTGKMKDSQQTYTVSATSNGNKIQGTAVENTLNLTFVLNGILNGNQLDMVMVLEYNGAKTQLNVAFFKQGSGATKSQAATNAASPKAKMPSNAAHDSNLIGKWTKNESYNSGYGDNAFSGNFQQSMLLFADGTVGDGGSRAGVSGSTYSGYSSGGAQALPGVYWYNIANQLYLYVEQNGQSQSLHLGKYYIENGKMLITATNGNKLFMTKD